MSTSTSTIQVTETTQRQPAQAPSHGDQLVLRLSAQGPSTEQRPHVSWTTGTVDNEYMSKKKSKCCCVYKKQKNWQDSSSGSDSEGETEHCRGHVDKKPPSGCGSGCSH